MRGPHVSAIVGDQAVAALRAVERIDELAAAPFDAAAYDAGEGALDASVLLRWEYRPGSAAYLVYSHAQPDAGGARPVLDPRVLRDGPAGDALLLEIAHGLAF